MSDTATEPTQPAGGVAAPAPPVPSPLALALAWVQADLPRITKSETGKVEKDGRLLYQYSYADLAGVSAAILPKLGEHGLAFTAWPTLRGDRFVLAYMLLHKDGERLEGEYPLKGGTAQAIGSEITYARRYCLCAVTGVAPDEDDDDAAAAQAEQSRFREPPATPDMPRDVVQGREQVKASWTVSFGWGDQAANECAAYYARWPHHQAPTLWDAEPAELRRFAAHLAALPPKVAGDDPATVTPPAGPSDQGGKPETGGSAEPVDAAARQMHPKDRAHIFALFKELGITSKREQLDTLGGITGREIESRGELTHPEAQTVIDVLRARTKSSSGAGAHADGPGGPAGSGADQTSQPPRPEEPAPDDTASDGDT